MRPAPLPALDGLRALSILLVLAAHAGFEHAVPGGLGVTVFFFVSGYLITAGLHAEHRATGRIAFGRFYLRRALRLVPACLVYVAVSGVAFEAIGGRIAPAAWAGATLYASNILEIFSHSFETNLPGTPHPFSILWSLAIEEHFYLVWPIALAILLRAPRTRMAALLVVALVTVLGWRIVLHGACHDHMHTLLCGPHANDRIYKSTDTRFDSLLWGALAALLTATRDSPSMRALAAPPARIAAVAALAVSILCRDPFFRDTFRTTLLGAGLLILVPPLASGAPMRRTLDSRPLVAIGRLSYSLYLWHWCALMLADHLRLPRPGFLALYSGLTIVLALASWHAIERPMLCLRRRAGSLAPDTLMPAPPYRASRIRNTGAVLAS